MAQLPISDFLTARLKEYDSNFELRSGTGFERLFFQPMQFIVQPFRDEATTIGIAQSFLKILAQDNPDAFDESSVDALASNLFVPRKTGAKAGGIARAYYTFAVDREYPATGAVFASGSGVQFTNPAPFKISSQEMSLNLEDGIFYFDIPVVAVNEGSSGTLAAGELVELLNDADVVSVTNKLAFSPGADKETNTQLISRSRQAIGVRDLVTGKGFRATMFDNFVASLSEIQPIGFGDPEMMRDIVYNAHIGGRVDGYVKTYNVLQGFKDFIGILIDTTRQSYTSSNLQLFGTDYTNVGNPNIDRSGGLNPQITEIKTSTSAIYTSPVNLSTPVNLSAAQFIRIGVDGLFKDVRVAGINPGATNRNEIVTLINTAFGVNVAFPYGNTIRIQSPTTGLASQLVFTQPLAGTSGLLAVLGLSPFGAPYTYKGDGPVTFIEGINFEVDDGNGLVRRIIGSTILPTQLTGVTTINSTNFSDPTTNIFLNVSQRDILTIQTGPDAGDYRILAIPTVNQLTLDTKLTTSLSGVSYTITRTGIKSGELVYITYYYNPLSVDVGRLVKLDSNGATRGIRPDREEFTITDLAFLRVSSVQIIDPLSHEPTGEVLDGNGGYGQGGYGQGAYGVGLGSDYYLIVNSPHERYSMFEDSYIVFRNGFEGQSVRVNYDYVPEISEYHDFVRGDSERVLDGDILIKHFIPAYVSGTIQYSVDTTDTSIPDVTTLTASVKDFINKTIAGSSLQVSDIEEYILSQIDPFKRYGAHIVPPTLTARIQNVNGTTTGVVSGDELIVPILDPFPKDTTQPLSPRITHWIADEIVMELL